MKNIYKIKIILLLIIGSIFISGSSSAVNIRGRTGGDLYFYGGDYLGDEGRNSWMVGGGYSYQFTEYWGAGFLYAYTPLKAVGNSTLDQNMLSKQTHILTFNAVINNPIVMKVGKGHLSCDLYLTLGTGPMKINSYWEPVGLVGGGLRIYLTHWAALRFDVNSYIHPLRRGGSEIVVGDLGMLIGLSILLPTMEKQSVEDTCPPCNEK